MPVRTCDHLKADGVYCGSPALHDRNYCYFHLNLRGRNLKAARARRRGDNPALDLPFPEDMHSVQMSLAEIMWAVADNRIDTKRAWAILNSLQQASNNLIRTPRWNGQCEAIPANRALRALKDPSFEQRYDLPNNVQIGCATPPSIGGVGISDPALKGHGFTGADRSPLLSESERASAREDSPTDNRQLATDDSLPDRVPIPEEEFKELKMTKWEEMEFFIYRSRFDREFSEDGEQQLKLDWLRHKRELTRQQYIEAQRTGSEDANDPLDGPEMNDSKEFPFGFCNTCTDDGIDNEQENEAA